MSIEVSLITKSYGAQKALDNVSFSAEKGQIIGFLGPNGAGKSTVMKILTGYITPDSGSVFVNGINVLKQAKAAQQHIGYLPEHNPLYKDMYVKEYLQFQASIFKVDKSQVFNCITRVGLTEEAHKKIHQLSKGYQQRVGIAAAILHNPAVLILDEPTTGLDPNQLVGIRALIKELGKDKTVLFSTHIMQEVQALCDRVIILKKGTILVDKPLTDLQNTTEQIIDVAFSNAVKKETLQQLPHIKQLINTGNKSWQLVFATKVDMRAEVFDFAQTHQLKIVELTAKQKNLETLFREVTNT